NSPPSPPQSCRGHPSCLSTTRRRVTQERHPGSRTPALPRTPTPTAKATTTPLSWYAWPNGPCQLPPDRGRGAPDAIRSPRRVADFARRGFDLLNLFGNSAARHDRTCRGPGRSLDHFRLDGVSERLHCSDPDKVDDIEFWFRHTDPAP